MAALDRDWLDNRLNVIRGRLDAINDEIKAIQARGRALTDPEFERVVALRGEHRVLKREEAQTITQLVQIRGPTANDIRRAQVRERAEQIAVQAAEMRQARPRTRSRSKTRSRSRSRSGPRSMSRSRSRSRSTGRKTRRRR